MAQAKVTLGRDEVMTALAEYVARKYSVPVAQTRLVYNDMHLYNNKDKFYAEVTVELKGDN